jgi:hypothetical protein
MATTTLKIEHQWSATIGDRRNTKSQSDLPGGIFGTHGPGRHLFGAQSVVTRGFAFTTPPMDGSYTSDAAELLEISDVPIKNDPFTRGAHA